MGDDVSVKTKGIHIAIVPDGNRRWARKRGLPVWKGHEKGSKRLNEMLDWVAEYPEIKTVSIFALSAENLERSKEEVGGLWNVFLENFSEMLNGPKAKERGCRVRIVGETGSWRPDVKSVARDLIDSTKTHSKFVLNILLAYGSRFEISDAVKKMMKRPTSALDNFLMVKEPVDMIIRTGGQHRLSNFLLYQAAYAELIFLDKFWPDITKEDFDSCMKEYFKRARKFGR